MSALSLIPARRSQRGAESRTTQSVIIHDRRRSSSADPREPTSSGMYCLRLWRSSSGKRSFHERRNAAMTGEAHCG